MKQKSMSIQHEDAFETELCEYLAAHGRVLVAMGLYEKTRELATSGELR